jgi:hypothetical protein
VAIVGVGGNVDAGGRVIEGVKEEQAASRKITATMIGNVFRMTEF